jgi:hypothetical protein
MVFPHPQAILRNALRTQLGDPESWFAANSPLGIPTLRPSLQGQPQPTSNAATIGGPPAGAYGLRDPMQLPAAQRQASNTYRQAIADPEGPVADRPRRWEIEPDPVWSMSIPEIVREAEAMGMTPATYYAMNVPKEKRDPDVLHTLAYGLPTPSNGETREQAAARMARMQQGYVNGQPVPSGPEADAIRAQFRNPTGPANPQTAADLAALDASAGRYANMIRGHGGSSDFDPSGAYGQAASGMGAGLPEDRRMQAQRMSLMSPSERALLASSPRRSPVQDMLAGAAGPAGAAGAAGAPGRETMTPEEAMARLMARKGGEVTHRGYMPANIAAIVDERTAPPATASTVGGPPVGAYGLGAAVGPRREDVVEELFGRYNAGRGKTRATISPERQAELASREKAVRDRGIARGKTIPSDILQDQMAMNFLRRNPAVAQEMIRLHGQNLDRGAAQLERDMEAQLKREEMQMRQGLGNDALKLQQMQALIDGGMSPEEAQAAIYGDTAGAGSFPAPGGGTGIADAGLRWSAREAADLEGLPPDDIVAYGRTAGWSDDKIQRALRKFGGSPHATAANPTGRMSPFEYFTNYGGVLNPFAQGGAMLYSLFSGGSK